MITRDAIVAEARTWLGTPWVHQACVKGAGVDCIGLIAGVAEALGMPEAKAWKADLRYRGYAPTPDANKLLEACADYLDWIHLRDALPGDILIFAYVVPSTRVKQPIHFGIVTELRPMMQVIHAYSPEPVTKVCENVINDTWRKRIHGARRYRGVV